MKHDTRTTIRRLEDPFQVQVVCLVPVPFRMHDIIASVIIVQSYNNAYCLVLVPYQQFMN